MVDLFIEPKYCVHINGRSQFSEFFLFVSVSVNCYTFTCNRFVQLKEGTRQLRKCVQ
jgi:hypothetical protein